MSNQEQHGNVLEAERTRTKPPPLYKVVLLNDDYTPMDFVVIVLQTVFSMSREKATQVMLQVHREGMGVCGTYTREVATTKVEQVIELARKHQHPLQCTLVETFPLPIQGPAGPPAAPEMVSAAATKSRKQHDCPGT
jgi:ATP-dependent Clp protease adaptor protein ClpS